jgi:hypothetical protein
LRLGGSFHHRCAIFSDPETKHFVGNWKENSIEE